MKFPEESIDSVRQVIGTVRNICAHIDEQGIIRNLDSDSSMVEIFNSDIIRFMLYLTASDGAVAEEEAEIISEILGKPIGVSQCVEILEGGGIYSTEFESSVPVSFQAIDMISNINGTNVGESLYTVYELIGKLIILSNESVHPQEIEDLNIYLATLRSHLDSSD